MKSIILSTLVLGTVVCYGGIGDKNGGILDSHRLSGFQENDAVTLEDTRSPYVVIENYVVPVGKTLSVMKGVTVLFEKGTGLLAQGELFVDGTTNNPAIFKGKTTGIGTWQGICLENSSSEISCAVIRGAKEGVVIKNCGASVRKSVISGNGVGVHCEGASGYLEDCWVIDNRGEGCIVSHGTTIKIDHTALCKNDGWGIWGHYKAQPQLKNSVVSGNRKGGIHCDYNNSRPSAHGCVFDGNKGFEVEHGDNMEWDFTENWWGAGMTSTLKSKGVTARLAKIKDQRNGSATCGFVNVSNYLIQKPNDCGPRVFPIVAGLSLKW